MKQSHNIALILAGGTGERMHAVVPKQFMEIDGETVLSHTMKAFQHHPLIHEVYLVCMPEWEDFVRNEATHGGIDKLGGVIEAGKSCYESACNGIKHLLESVKEPNTIVLIHDAVRPLITQDIISRINAAPSTSTTLTPKRFSAYCTAPAENFAVVMNSPFCAC